MAKKPYISPASNTQDQRTASEQVRQGRDKPAWSRSHTEFGGYEKRRNENIQKAMNNMKGKKK